MCWLCGSHGADTIDHKVAGDNHQLDNLAPVHDRNAPHCHRYKSADEGHKAMQVLRRKLDLPRETHPGLLSTD